MSVHAGIRDELLDLGSDDYLPVWEQVLFHPRAPRWRLALAPAHLVLAGLLTVHSGAAAMVLARHREPVPRITLDASSGTGFGIYVGLVTESVGPPSNTAALRAAHLALDETCYPQLAVAFSLQAGNQATGRFVVTGHQKLPLYTKIRRVPPFRAVLQFQPNGHVHYRLSAPGLGCA